MFVEISEIDHFSHAIAAPYLKTNRQYESRSKPLRIVSGWVNELRQKCDWHTQDTPSLVRTILISQAYILFRYTAIRMVRTRLDHSFLTSRNYCPTPIGVIAKMYLSIKCLTLCKPDSTIDFWFDLQIARARARHTTTLTFIYKQNVFSVSARSDAVGMNMDVLLITAWNGPFSCQDVTSTFGCQGKCME
jgi:hypothetical protein